jgi:hypothetical protein
MWISELAMNTNTADNTIGSHNTVSPVITDLQCILGQWTVIPARNVGADSIIGHP